MTNNETASDMRELHDALLGAYQRLDGPAIKALYAKRSEDLYFWARKMTYTWEELEFALDGLIEIASEFRFSTSNLRVGGSGNFGWFAATYHVERDREGGESWSIDGRWTMVAEKIDGEWLIIHDHESFPATEPAVGKESRG